MRNKILVFTLISFVLLSCRTGEDRVYLQPEFSPIGGVYKSQVEVSIKSDHGDRVYYSVDSSTPTKNSLKYSGKITLNEPTLLRAVAYKRDGSTSNAMTMFDFDFKKDKDEYTKSPVWSDQIIYFALLDRMENGDRSNDDLGFNENSVDEETWFSGGDFKGLTQKLDYIKNLGATAIWITPPIKNEWSEGNFGGSHGYWASNFLEVDPHYGTLEDYKNFVDEAHKKGLYVIQDIVVNHVGDYFNVSRSDGSWSLKGGTLPTNTPEQLPWSFNNPELFTADELEYNSFYNWTPAISDFNDKSQLLTYQLSNLDDIRTTNPVVRNLLKGYYSYWIDKVDIDGYRVDTVKYVEQDFFEDFANNGVKEYAKSLGKEDFILFGESWDQDEDLNASYTLGKNGEKRLDSVIYFNLNFAIRNVFGNGNPTDELSKVLDNRFSAGYQDASKLITFVDNHDMERLITSTTENMVKSAYAFIMTIPGIPQLYYGTEQNFSERRRAMFKGGYKSKGVANDMDYFDTSSPWYRYIKALTKLRMDNPVFRNGELTIIKDNTIGSGLFAYKMVDKTGSEALIVFNTSNQSKVGIDIDGGFKANSSFKLLEPSSNSMPKSILADKNGNITIAVEKESFGIYLFDSVEDEVSNSSSRVDITSSFKSNITDSSLIITGNVSEKSTVGIFLDGNYKQATEFSASDSWSTSIDLTSITNGEHEIVAYIKAEDISNYIYSKPVVIKVQKPYVPMLEVVDEKYDENYTQPTNESFIGQEDIHVVNVLTSGTDIRLDLKMNKTTNVWGPNTNDFDHVLFNIFLQKEGSDSQIVELPRLNAKLPSSMTSWDYYVSMAGWSSTIENSLGEIINPSPTSSVDHENSTVSIYIPSASIGSPKSLKGWKLYITTWDEDSGNLRDLTIDGDEWVFGGADGSVSPLIMDDVAVITLK
ncbi:hypothetical protein EW093_04410 [Thiospirochaeta perfilievii]|uniref:Glycosyl hydrolase family 13 catalytic domain-containing protein n=1 Tax=Thiospirochaeta perfilievii TaxID=252967 RepID=A0A5C1Q7C1_9SPIO|nr:alpha-amylase family glycosyl hydrolase [Thiospirochaeta perfilievii]QEN03973.1 hypothetical protein EW093_04410 [Thiospirochaeta perfilievii]